MSTTTERPLGYEAKPTDRRVAGEVQTWPTADVMAAIECTTRGSWLAEVMRAELRARGVGYDGRWVGFPEAAKVWASPTEGEGSADTRVGR